MSTASPAAFYARTAEFVAVLLGPAWAALGPALSAALDGLDVGSGAVVDVGAGTGLGTAVIAKALPEARVVAVEPDRALRTALLSRVVDDPGLRARVTVLGSDLLAAELPEKIAGLVAMNVIGHFDRAARTRIWQLLAVRLTPGGRAVVNLSPPYEPAALSLGDLGEVTMGRRRYVGSAAAEPDGPDTIVWEMSYRVEEDGRTIEQFSVRDGWHVFSPEDLGREVEPHGLVLRPVADPSDMLVIERA